MGEARRQSLRHEFLTPLNQIIGYAELLEEESAERGQDDLLVDLRRIQAAARHLLELINQVAEQGQPRGAERGFAAILCRGRDEEDAEAVPVVHSEDELPARRPPPTPVLVVDDNPQNLDLLSRRLSSRGYQVHTAASGQEALARIAVQKYALVLLDVMMPKMSGLEVLQHIRRSHFSADLPVIMATARQDSAIVVESLRLGANDYVTKPLDLSVVLARMETQLSLAEAKHFIRHTFGRYLSEDIVAELLENPAGLELGGERRKVTILMSDLRGFSTLCAAISPEQILKLLNNYLGRMAEIIFRHGGTIDEFIGDAILAIFGAPKMHGDDALRAVACAAEMQRAMDEVNAFNAREGLPAVEMGIGINTGDAVVGNIGSSTRAKYGVVGTAVNLTSRIESMTVGGQVLLSEATLQEAGATVRAGPRQTMLAKGMPEPVAFYPLEAVGELTLPSPDEPLRQLSPEVAVTLRVIAGKEVIAQDLRGWLVAVGERGAHLRTEVSLTELTNIKLDGGAYAKVQAAVGPLLYLIRFTSLTPGYLHALARVEQTTS